MKMALSTEILTLCSIRVCFSAAVAIDGCEECLIEGEVIPELTCKSAAFTPSLQETAVDTPRQLCVRGPTLRLANKAAGA